MLHCRRAAQVAALQPSAHPQLIATSRESSCRAACSGEKSKLANDSWAQMQDGRRSGAQAEPWQVLDSGISRIGRPKPSAALQRPGAGAAYSSSAPGSQVPRSGSQVPRSDTSASASASAYSPPVLVSAPVARRQPKPEGRYCSLALALSGVPLNLYTSCRSERQGAVHDSAYQGAAVAAHAAKAASPVRMQQLIPGPQVQHPHYLTKGLCAMSEGGESQVAAGAHQKECTSPETGQQKGSTWLQVTHIALILVHLSCMLLSWEITLPEYGCMAPTAA